LGSDPGVQPRKQNGLQKMQAVLFCFGSGLKTGVSLGRGLKTGVSLSRGLKTGVRAPTEKPGSDP